jgi:hypothetical protein
VKSGGFKNSSDNVVKRRYMPVVIHISNPRYSIKTEISGQSSISEYGVIMGELARLQLLDPTLENLATQLGSNIKKQMRQQPNISQVFYRGNVHYTVKT